MKAKKTASSSLSKPLQILQVNEACGLESLRGRYAAEGIGPKTISDRMLIIKRFFGFPLAEGYIEEDPPCCASPVQK